MCAISLYEDRSLLKEALLNKIKSYRNFSVKFALLFFMASFAIYYSYITLKTSHLSLRVDETLYGSSLFSLTFAVIGYCIGAVFGTHLQREQINYVAKIRQKKRQLLEEQIAIRQAKIESL